MTETTTTVPGSPDNAGGDVTGNTNAGDWTSGFDTPLREMVTNKGWSGPSEALTSYAEMERELTTLKTPTNYAATDYKFTAPENPKEVGYSTELSTALAGWAAEAGMSPEAAAKIHDSFWAHTQNVNTQNANSQTEALNKTLGDTEAALTREWGTPESATFQRNMLLAQRTAQQLGIEGDLISSGMLHQDADGVHVANAKVFSALAKVGNAMFAEDAVFGNPDTGTNPFDPKTANLKQQGELVKNDPAKALTLIDALPQSERAKMGYLRSTIAERLKL